jgi:hypothetical protein
VALPSTVQLVELRVILAERKTVKPVAGRLVDRYSPERLQRRVLAGHICNPSIDCPKTGGDGGIELRRRLGEAFHMRKWKRIKFERRGGRGVPRLHENALGQGRTGWKAVSGEDEIDGNGKLCAAEIAEPSTLIPEVRSEFLSCRGFVLSGAGIRGLHVFGDSGFGKIRPASN